MILDDKAGSQRGGLEQELGRAQGIGVILICFNALEQLFDDWMSRVDFEGLLLVCIEILSGVLGLGIGLGLHDAFHVARPAIGGCDQSGWGLGKTLRDNSLFDLNYVIS